MDMSSCALLFLTFLIAYVGHLVAAFASPLPEHDPPQKTTCAACLRIRVDPVSVREITANFMLEKKTKSQE